MKCCMKPMGSTAWEQWFLSLCACVTVRPCGCLLQNQDGEFTGGVANLSSFTDFSSVSLSNSPCFDFPHRKIEFAIPFFLSWFHGGWSRTVMLPLLPNREASRGWVGWVGATHPWLALCLVHWFLISPGALEHCLEPDQFYVLYVTQHSPALASSTGEPPCVFQWRFLDAVCFWKILFLWQKDPQLFSLNITIKPVFPRHAWVVVMWWLLIFGCYSVCLRAVFLLPWK